MNAAENSKPATDLPISEGVTGVHNPAPGSARLPFKLKIYDESGEHTVGPLWLDVPHEGAWEPVPADFPGGHWEHIARMEKWVKTQILTGDIQCSLDTDALMGPPPAGADGPNALASGDWVAVARGRIAGAVEVVVNRGERTRLCSCSCSDRCPLGKSGSEVRCTVHELNAFIVANTKAEQ
jgi:hypothetical protein